MVQSAIVLADRESAAPAAPALRTSEGPLAMPGPAPARTPAKQPPPLYATDEPASLREINATTVLVRRVKQGAVEWFRSN